MSRSNLLRFFKFKSLKNTVSRTVLYCYWNLDCQGVKEISAIKLHSYRELDTAFVVKTFNVDDRCLIGY
jgi:hypothetical protein